MVVCVRVWYVEGGFSAVFLLNLLLLSLLTYDLPVPVRVITPPRGIPGLRYCCCEIDCEGSD